MSAELLSATVCLFVRPTICLSVCPFVQASVCLFVVCHCLVVAVSHYVSGGCSALDQASVPHQAINAAQISALRYFVSHSTPAQLPVELF